MNTVYEKELKLDGFYIKSFIKNDDLPYILFVNGGPGMSSALLENLIQKKDIFKSLKYNFIIYDQRSCGKSFKSATSVLHKDNVSDLNLIYRFLISQPDIKIKSMIGHSYGAKLLLDYETQYSSGLPLIFTATANSILTPRINNLLIDLAYIKLTNRKKYDELLPRFNNFDTKLLWEITDELADIFSKNPTRPYYYWANMQCFDEIESIKKEINYSINNDVFKSVRNDLYTNEKNFSVNLEELSPDKYLLINGFHDLIMCGYQTKEAKNHLIYMCSAHYPHIEENLRFCEDVNVFLEKK